MTTEPLPWRVHCAYKPSCDVGPRLRLEKVKSPRQFPDGGLLPSLARRRASGSRMLTTNDSARIPPHGGLHVDNIQRHEYDTKARIDTQISESQRLLLIGSQW